jgi:class III poly(R)-hydroxyalkanoic acid synthase PhaE subunit
MLTTSPWVEALDLWWQALSASISETNQPLFKKFFDQSKSYFRFNEEIIKVFQTIFTNETLNNSDEVLLLEKGFAALRENFKQLLINNPDQTLSSWELPLENWRQTITLLTNLTDNLLSPSITEAVKSTQFGYEKLWQPVSLSQKWQKILETRIRLWRNYQQAQEEYVAWVNKISLHTIDLLRDKIITLRQQNQPITQFRAIYDLWIDCGEEAYIQSARTDEYSQINARLINSWMAWKHYECQQIDEILAILNIPTRQEVDRMNYRLQQMRRESKTPRNGISEKLIAELYKEINTLKSEVAQLKSHPQPANSSRRSSRKKMSSTSLTELHPASKDVASNSNDEPQNGGGE